MPKCLILGGGGFIGSHLSHALLRRGHPVRVFERPVPEQLVAERARGPIEWVYGDFLNQSDVAEAVAGCDIVFHLISTTLPKSSNDNPQYDVQTNLAGSLSVLEAARSTGVQRIIFVSSGGTVYGVPKSTPISESHPTDPICSYGITKLAIEKYLHLYYTLYGLDYLVLRIANPFGEGQRPDAIQGAVGVFLNRAIRNEVIEIWGDGSIVRDYLYIDDVTDAFMRGLDYHGELRVMNVGAARGYSLNELLAAMEAVLGNPIERRYIAARAFDVPVNVLDSTRARDLLGWTPRISLQEGLTRTANWLKRTARPPRPAT
jgi:UDP-glucose 4-epimerase